MATDFSPEILDQILAGAASSRKTWPAKTGFSDD
jgi:hypothetical protein